MTSLSLSGEWILKLPNETVPATVPGSLYADLIRAGKLDNPYDRDNEMAALAWMEGDYTYERTFTMPEDMMEYPVLICEGLDTLCDLYLNGKHIGSAENMHRRYELPLSSMAKTGENTLTIVFHSPTRYIKEAQAKCSTDGSHEAMEGFAHIRKAHCMFGWDWGARLPDMGIWRDIYIENRVCPQLLGGHVRQRHEPGQVTLEITPEFYSDEPEYSPTKAWVVTPDGKTLTADNQHHVVIEKPALWYPNGYGEQPLYEVTLVQFKDDHEVARWTRKIGLRTIDVRREKDEFGESFAFVVNGIAIFSMGADYIPEDHILSRTNKARTRRLLEDAVLANMNTVRVWGGGIYPGDDFYDLCDELGLLVWQDFMFACAVYELTPAFETNIRHELIDNIRRLRHHASLALWCGNNEMEWQLGANMWNHTHKQLGDYYKMYETLFPHIVKTHDPDRFYWPASPSSGGCFDDANDPNRGDVHYWDVWHGEKPFTDYRKFHFRFASEFGFQALPHLATIESFTKPEDRNLFSYIMEKHQRHNAANGKIMKYLSQTFLYPSTFPLTVYASQLLQAEAIRYGVEHWRRNRGRCMGAIYWQLNDCWPVISWASIDYFGRWKALHYAAKRFFAPLMISIEETGGQDANVNAEVPFTVPKAKLSVANETTSAFSGKVHWALRGADASIVESGEFAAEVPALSSLWLEELSFPDADPRSMYLSCALLNEAGDAVSSNACLFCPPKHFRFVDPLLAVSREGDTITVRAGAFAKSVELYADDPDLLLSDNFFDLDSGDKTVTILRGNPETFFTRSVFNIR